MKLFISVTSITKPRRSSARASGCSTRGTPERDPRTGAKPGGVITVVAKPSGAHRRRESGPHGCCDPQGLTATMSRCHPHPRSACSATLFGAALPVGRIGIPRPGRRCSTPRHHPSVGSASRVLGGAVRNRTTHRRAPDNGDSCWCDRHDVPLSMRIRVRGPGRRRPKSDHTSSRHSERRFVLV
jgi:hypothetical protein